ncbi:hypothetical protein [Microbacterium murale]|uniref:Ribosomally synthesized peptide with SipW-like signal peptide n=1 Tax=Microbacterium murale TaxID=1081040 RepID=A0ABQ1RR28_9MICO|nr:hypothetical protein [Microbacterium murale]GGD75319.1 hypothetical protein GCM10007269_17960 [Microbacterium murale]
MTSSHIETVPSQERRNKRRPFIAFGLAVLAIGGIGAAATSAAWTDNGWFSASASAATFDLQVSLDGKTWSQGAAKTVDGVTTIDVKVPSTAYANLLPGQKRDVNLWVRNDSSVAANLTKTVGFAEGSTFAANPSATLSGLAETLAPTGQTGSDDQFLLSLTTPADWTSANVGKSGTVVVTLTATATS